MDYQRHFYYASQANKGVSTSPRNHEFVENEQCDYVPRCSYCKNPLRDDSNVYMFLDNKFCSEVCRDNAITMYEQRHY